MPYLVIIDFEATCDEGTNPVINEEVATDLTRRIQK
jgi:inhibitor of KinA sporulation pathway (predicted exonuclease)